MSSAHIPDTPFAHRLRPLVETVGVSKSAALLGVTRRTVHLWLTKPEKPPNAASQAGALLILGKESRRSK